MDGQMLGGGVVMLVAALLWLLYLLPSIMRRARYDAAERNALRLNRALRVLAETSETPEEVRVELSAKQARQQQRAAARAQAEVERLQRERDEIEAERARLERERELAELEEQRRRIASEQAELARRGAEREDESRTTGAQRAAGRRAGGARDGVSSPRAGEWDALLAVDAHRRAPTAAIDEGRARARRRVRLCATLAAAAGIALAGWGLWLAAQALAPSAWAGFVAGGIAMLIVGTLTLRRMAAVARRAAARSEAAPEAKGSGAGGGASPASRRDASALIDERDRGWVPRSIPAPLSSTAGSRAASTVDAAAARERLLAAAREEAARDRAERQNPSPVPISSARRPEEPAAAPAPSSYAAMGYVDDAEIEQHIRALLARRVAG